jgi:hypothetical protein
MKSSCLICCGVLLALAAVAGASMARSGAKVRLRLFDPRGRVPAQVSLAGIVRSETRALRLPRCSPGSGRISLA